MSQLVLRGARVADGSRSPARMADVRVAEGRIAEVGEVTAGPDALELDLGGLVLAPGFIDIHTHYDAQVFWDADFTPSSWHGVTTVVIGNTGFGVAPARPADRHTVLETLAHVEGMNVDALSAGIDWSFETYPEYLDAVDRQPKRVNVASFLPHSMVRLYAMGAEAATTRAATPAELDVMCGLTRDALDAGAIGVSTSQAPTQMGALGRPVPSRLATADEIRALVGAMALFDRRIAEITYGPVFEIDEVAALSKELGVRITWGSLLTGLFGGPGATMAMLDRASAVGGDIWPQVSCLEIAIQMSLLNPYYFNMVPAFATVIGTDPGTMRARYADRDWRDKARPDVPASRPGAYDRISIE